MGSTDFFTSLLTAPGQPDELLLPLRRTRALVLGGGGSTGNAWLIGLLAGLEDVGLDVTGADLVIGTSAGATAAAQITAAPLPELHAAALVPAPAVGSRPTGSSNRSVVNHLDDLTAIITAAAGPSDLRRRLGAAVLASDSATDAAAERWRATVAARLPRREWPDREVLITAVDAETGDPVVFGRSSGVELAAAVAASTANGFGVPPQWIDGRPFIDGAHRRNENADLAAGAERVLVLSPLGGRSLHPAAWRTGLAAQVEDLEASGSRVATVVPRPTDEHLFGVNAMDLALRPAAAKAGFDQGRARAGELADLWR